MRVSVKSDICDCSNIAFRRRGGDERRRQKFGARHIAQQTADANFQHGTLPKESQENHFAVAIGFVMPDGNSTVEPLRLRPASPQVLMFQRCLRYVVSCSIATATEQQVIRPREHALLRDTSRTESVLPVYPNAVPIFPPQPLRGGHTYRPVPVHYTNEFRDQRVAKQAPTLRKACAGMFDRGWMEDSEARHRDCGAGAAVDVGVVFRAGCLIRIGLSRS